jgi:Natural resistance-associated macrophage protein-like/Domain of unknown function (DUF4142)
LVVEPAARVDRLKGQHVAAARLQSARERTRPSLREESISISARSRQHRTELDRGEFSGLITMKRSDSSACARTGGSQKSLMARAARVLGPGLTTGASEDDPSGIATYSQAGAEFGYSMLWTMLLSYPLMTAIQEISARIGRITGKGLAGNIRDYCPRWMAYSMVLAVFLANAINIGADIAAMGSAIRLLIGGPLVVYVQAQVAGHEKMRQLLDHEAKTGKDADLKAFAEKTLPTVEEQYQMAKELNAKIGK